MRKLFVNQLNYLSLKITLWAWSTLAEAESMCYTLTHNRGTTFLAVRFKNKSGCDMQLRAIGKAPEVAAALTKMIKEEL